MGESCALKMLSGLSAWCAPLLPVLLAGCVSVPPPPSVACEELDSGLATREVSLVETGRLGHKYAFRGIPGKRIRFKVEPVNPRAMVYIPSGGVAYAGESFLVECVGRGLRAGIDLELPEDDDGTYFVYVQDAASDTPTLEFERVTFAADKPGDRKAGVAAVAAPSAPTPIYGNTGKYMSPFTEDGTVAPWVEKGMTATVGANVGSSLGAYAGQQMLENVPVFGSLLGATVGKSIGREMALSAARGWEFIKSSSDLSFDSLDDMARYLVATNASHPQFVKVLTATYGIYPELEKSIAAAIRQR